MKECPFCNLHKDKDENITLENEYCLFIQKDDEQLILEGCGLIVPKAHKENVFELSREEWNATYDLLQEAKKLLDKNHSPDGYSLGWNVGAPSNQHIDHSHFHVIPRFNDEPHAGKGIRYWLKQHDNMRPSRIKI